MPKDFAPSEAPRTPAPQPESPQPPVPQSPVAEQRETTALRETPAVPPPAEAGTPPARRGGGIRRLLLVLVGLLALGLAAWYGHGYWTDGRFLVETDDAYVDADFAVLAPKLTGYVAAVPARANAPVKAGDPLVALEDGDYRSALAVAEAQLAAQQAMVARIEDQALAGQAGVTQAEARVASAEALRVQAEADLQRYTRLASNDVASAQQLEAARAGAATAEAGLAEAKAGVATAEANLEVTRAQATEAQATIPGLAASRDKARRDLDATVLRAPVDGVVGNLSVAAGDYVTPGKRLLAVVPLTAVYVDANFKETQIEPLAPGSKVEVTVDAFPDRSFTGTVEGVSPASGSVFSLLPPENATGNFTKVVQRVPVRISVPAEVAAQGWLRPGLSVTVTADPRTAPAAAS